MFRAVISGRTAALVIALSFPASWSANAEESARAAGEMVEAARMAALDKLFSERGSADAFERAAREAREAGVAEQAVIEARFLYHVDKEDDAALVAMLPELVKREAGFKLEDSAIFSLPEDWRAVIEYVRALAALESGDRAAFKRHITEAFWLSPRQAAAFAPHIERLRLAETMRDLKLDLAVDLSPVIDNGQVTLADLMDDRKALLLHFWSPWSAECEAAMPGFLDAASLLSGHGIAVVSLIADQHPQLAEDARETVRSLGKDAPGYWFFDPNRGDYSRRLRVRDLPTVVLVSADGTVLFNGALHDDALWNALSRIEAKIARPDSLRRDAR